MYIMNGKIGKNREKTTQILCQIVCFLILKWDVLNFYAQLLQEVGVVAGVQNMAMPHKVQLFRGNRGRVFPSFSTQAEFLAPKTDLKKQAK